MTLHHVKGTSAAARTFFEILLHGGRVAIADLDSDNWEFHEAPDIAEHDGFNRNNLQWIFEEAGFDDVIFSEGDTIYKTSSRTGKPRNFTIFLMTAPGINNKKRTIQNFFYVFFCKRITQARFFLKIAGIVRIFPHRNLKKNEHGLRRNNL